MKCGYFHTPYILPHRSAPEVFDWSLKLAVVCDEAGFADFMIGEHSTLAWENIPSPEIIIGACVNITKNIRFAPMAHLLPYHNPATLAMQVGWLSQILKERYFFGVAPGGHHTDAILHGYSSVGELFEPMLEALALIERIWDGKPFLEQGKHFKAGFPGPDTMPGYDVLIANNAPWGGRENLEIAVTGLSAPSPSMKFAGERNYSPISFFGGTAQMRSHWETWSAAAQAAGYATDRSRFRICRDIFIADSDAEAKRRAKDSGLGECWRQYLMPIYKKFNLLQGLIDDSGTSIAPNDIDEDFLAEHVWLCGSPATVVRKLEQMAEVAGPWGMIVINSHDNMDNSAPYFESLQRLAQEVAPKMRLS